MNQTKSFLISGYAEAGSNGILAAALDTEAGTLAFSPVSARSLSPSSNGNDIDDRQWRESRRCHSQPKRSDLNGVESRLLRLRK